MDASKNILLVTNAMTDNEIMQIKQAMEAKKLSFPIKLSLVHVLPNLPTSYFNIPSMVLLAERYYEEAKQSLNSVGEFLGITPHDQWLITGRARPEVLRLANKLNTHFILASSTIVTELRKPFMFRRKEQNPMPIRTISQVNLLDTANQ